MEMHGSGNCKVSNLEGKKLVSRILTCKPTLYKRLDETELKHGQYKTPFVVFLFLYRPIKMGMGRGGEGVFILNFGR